MTADQLRAIEERAKRMMLVAESSRSTDLAGSADDITSLVAVLRAERAEKAKLVGALQGSRARANVMGFLWKAAEEEMRSDDPVEVRLRQDLEDADASYQELCKVNAQLRAEVERLRAERGTVGPSMASGAIGVCNHCNLEVSRCRCCNRCADQDFPCPHCGNTGDPDPDGYLKSVCSQCGTTRDLDPDEDEEDGATCCGVAMTLIKRDPL